MRAGVPYGSRKKVPLASTRARPTGGARIAARQGLDPEAARRPALAAEALEEG